MCLAGVVEGRSGAPAAIEPPVVYGVSQRDGVVEGRTGPVLVRVGVSGESQHDGTVEGHSGPTSLVFWEPGDIPLTPVTPPGTPVAIEGYEELPGLEFHQILQNLMNREKPMFGRN